MTVEQLRNTTLLWIIGLYIIFNAGFMQLRIPPGGMGIPLGDIVMVLSLVTISHTRIAPLFARTAFIVPFLIWWGLGIGRSLLGFGDYGFWSLRDALHVIESLFIYIGFAFAIRPSNIERYYRWLALILTIAGFYILFYPMSEFLQSMSPSVTAAAGYQRALFFQYQSFYCVGIMVVGYLLIFRAPGSGLRNFLIAAGLIAFMVMFFQARTLYLQVFALSLIFMFFRPKAFGKSTLIIAMGVALLTALPILDLNIEGRLGTVSLDLIFSHLMTSFGEVQNKHVAGAAHGTTLRTFWWGSLLRDVTSSVPNMLFGLGYGFPLVDLPGALVDIREPHNSYISIISRIGFIGFGAFLWMHFILLRVWSWAYRECGRMNWKLGQNRLLIVLVYSLAIWIHAFTEDGFEKPFITIPYYFSWGIVLAFAYNLRRGAYVPLAANNRAGIRSALPERISGL